MKLCYIAGPYRAKTIYGIQQNIRAAEAVALKYWRKGFAVICPHKNTALFDGAMPDETWLAGAIEIMKRCDVIVVMQGYENSVGTKFEILEAAKLGMKVIFDE